MESEPELNKSEKNSLPKWLRKLADESWQAELLISGLAILGAAQLPSLLYMFSDWLLLNVQIKYLWVFNFLLIYLGVAALVLLFNFSIHFAMRTFWVGMVGLSSVYPDGIGPLREVVKDYYVDDVKKNYPNLQQVIIRTEKACSIVFSATSMLVMMFVGISTVIAGFVLLAMLIENLTNSSVAFDDVMTYALGGLFVCMMLLSMVNYTPLVKNPRIERFMVAYSRMTRKLFNPLFDKSGGYLYTVFMTRLSLKGFAVYGFVYYVLLMFSYFYMVNVSSLKLLSNPERGIYEAASREDRVFAGAYLNERETELTSFQPGIAQAQYENGETMLLFIPELADDSHWIEERCELKKIDDTLEAQRRRIAIRGRWQVCASQYWKVKFDDVEQPWNPQRYRLLDQADGWTDRILLPASLSAGKHELTLHMKRDTGYVIRARIPFWIMDK